MGAVTEEVRKRVPGSYRAMLTASSDTHPSYYTQSDVQSLADYVKFRLFGTVVQAAAEASLYDPLLLNFVGKLTTLQFIPAAVDYWGDQLIQESTTGTNENVTYPDRRPELWRVFDSLRAEVNGEFSEMAEKYGFIIYGGAGNIPQVTYGDNGRGVLITEDPQNWPALGEHRSGTEIGIVWW